MTNSQKRRAENEVVFKERNDAIKALAKEVFSHDDKIDIALKFTCECSNEDCRELVELTVEQYEAARKNNRQFIIKPGHEQVDIEKVVKHDGHNIVEKLAEPPQTDGHLNKT